MKNIYSVTEFEKRWNTRKALLQPSGDSAVSIAGDKKTNRYWRQAAVFIGLVERDGEARIILTKRAQGMRDHSGQISFPGGKVEKADETFEKTALREANEEIGLCEMNVRLLGRQPFYYTGTGFEIAPIIGIIEKPQTFISNGFEVALIFEVPLSFLMNPANHVRDKRDINAKEYIFYAMSYKDHYIWGATAGMIRLLYERLYQ